MKKRPCFLFLLSFLLIQIAHSQTTIVLQPGPEGKDAQLWSIMPDMNIGNTPKFLCSGWTHYGEPGINRGLIDFDLSSIPTGAVITKASLSLYFLCLEPSFFGHSGINDAFLQLITEPWNEESVTWNTQPMASDTGRVYLPQSDDPYQDYTDIEVTELVQHLHARPELYHGLMLKLINEWPYNCLLFASGDYSDTIEMRPRLEVTYMTNPFYTLILQPGPEGKDAQLWTIMPDNNYGNIPKFDCAGWTHYGVPGVNRGIIDFDLSALPEGAQITNAKLNLYFVCLEPSYFGHTGENDAYLQLITDPWEEETVTWNTQPMTTETDQVYLPPSIDPYMDYTDIDVTALIQKLFSDPETYHGIMLRLLDESPYRCLLFASGDYMDHPEMRPKLEITFSSSEYFPLQNNETEDPGSIAMSIYPNPASVSVNIVSNITQKATLSIVDLNGRLMLEREADFNPNGEIGIDVSKYPSGIYMARITAGENSITRKFIVTH